MENENSETWLTHSMCCNADIVRKGRAHYRCAKCDKDLSLELVLLAVAKDMLEDE